VSAVLNRQSGPVTGRNREVRVRQLDTIEALRAACDDARAAGRSVGLVPTMGFLHAGHRSLMQAARRETDFVVVTLFVNPLQFGANEDLDRYPRDLRGDAAACTAEGVDVLFAPTVAEMYPRPTLTTVHVEALTASMCGLARPAHFDGVTTVVTKLFAITGRCRAYFGRKDAQQLAVVTRMAADLNLPVEVVGCPIVREPDGLALSSRNAYLDPEQRRAASVLSRALRAAGDATIDGERDATRIAALVRAFVATEPSVDLEYVDVRDAHELTAIGQIDGDGDDVLVALAARIGATRVIDNIRITTSGDAVHVDSGVTMQQEHSCSER
jgi:pantoate--beta-alanine ligase